jgi:hypothetical protein
MAQSQQTDPQRLGLSVGQIGQATGLATAAGQADPQLGQTKDSSKTGAHHVDRLDLTQRKAF